jgi:hypothetical protein
MKTSELFEVLEPPPHGWTRLSTRLTEHRTPLWRPALGAAFAVAVVVLGTLTTHEPEPSEPPADLMALAMTEPVSAETLGVHREQEPVTVYGGNAAVMRLPSSNPNVLMYRLATVSDAE